MWFLPVGSWLIPPGSLPGEAGFTPRTLTRPAQATTSQDPRLRRAVSAARRPRKTQPSAPSEPPRSPRLRVRQPPRLHEPRTAPRELEPRRARRNASVPSPNQERFHLRRGGGECRGQDLVAGGCDEDVVLDADAGAAQG